MELVKYGNKLLLTQDNCNYRAASDNPIEREAIKQDFAESVLWGFPITKNKSGARFGIIQIGSTDFLHRDAYGIANKFKSKKQGIYKLDNAI